MTPKEQEEINRMEEALRHALSVPVWIDHGQILKVIVSDLTAKYRSNVERGDTEWAAVFEKVLSYYLSPEELAAITAKTP